MLVYQRVTTPSALVRSFAQPCSSNGDLRAGTLPQFFNDATTFASETDGKKSPKDPKVVEEVNHPYIYTYICIYMYIYVYVYVCVYVCVYIYTHIYTLFLDIVCFIYQHIYIYTHVCIHIAHVWVYPVYPTTREFRRGFFRLG